VADAHETRLALDQLARRIRAELVAAGIREVSSPQLAAALERAATAVDIGSIELLLPSDPTTTTPLDELTRAWAESGIGGADPAPDASTRSTAGVDAPPKTTGRAKAKGPPKAAEGGG
jgi:hypothetical protein